MEKNKTAKITDISKAAAIEWKKLNDVQKKKYIDAFQIEQKKSSGEQEKFNK